MGTETKQPGLEDLAYEHYQAAYVENVTGGDLEEPPDLEVVMEDFFKAGFSVGRAAIRCGHDPVEHYAGGQAGGKVADHMGVCDAWICVDCDNRPGQDGFDSVDEQGNYVEFPAADWPGLMRCNRCGVVFDSRYGDRRGKPNTVLVNLQAVNLTEALREEIRVRLEVYFDRLLEEAAEGRLEITDVDPGVSIDPEQVRCPLCGRSKAVHDRLEQGVCPGPVGGWDAVLEAELRKATGVPR